MCETVSSGSVSRVASSVFQQTLSAVRWPRRRKVECFASDNGADAVSKSVCNIGHSCVLTATPDAPLAIHVTLYIMYTRLRGVQ